MSTAPDPKAVERARRLIRALLQTNGFTPQEARQRRAKARHMAEQHGLLAEFGLKPARKRSSKPAPPPSPALGPPPPAGPSAAPKPARSWAWTREPLLWVTLGLALMWLAGYCRVHHYVTYRQSNYGMGLGLLLVFWMLVRMEMAKQRAAREEQPPVAPPAP